MGHTHTHTQCNIIFYAWTSYHKGLMNGLVTQQQAYIFPPSSQNRPTLHACFPESSMPGRNWPDIVRSQSLQREVSPRGIVWWNSSSVKSTHAILWLAVFLRKTVCSHLLRQGGLAGFYDKFQESCLLQRLTILRPTRKCLRQPLCKCAIVGHYSS